MVLSSMYASASPTLTGCWLSPMADTNRGTALYMNTMSPEEWSVTWNVKGPAA